MNQAMEMIWPVQAIYNFDLLVASLCKRVGNKNVLRWPKMTLLN